MRKRWDEDARNVVVDSEITHTSSDGVTWVEATEREKQGWISGMVEALQAERAVLESRPGYVRDLATLENNYRKAEIALNRLLHAFNTTEEHIQAARDALDAAGDVVRKERVRIRMEPL